MASNGTKPLGRCGPGWTMPGELHRVHPQSYGEPGRYEAAIDSKHLSVDIACIIDTRKATAEAISSVRRRSVHGTRLCHWVRTFSV